MSSALGKYLIRTVRGVCFRPSIHFSPPPKNETLQSIQQDDESTSSAAATIAHRHRFPDIGATRIGHGGRM
jgi:hypothetical protein